MPESVVPILFHSPDECCGCMACVNVCPKDAISVVTDENGFVFPHINPNLCIRCHKCIGVCDFKKTDLEEQLGNAPISSFAAVNQNKKVLSKSASGGVFPAVADWVVGQKGYVAGCVFNDEWKPCHIVSNKEDDLTKMQNSKYAQSDVGLVYREIKKLLDSDEWVLFSGTPCQCAALYRVLGSREKYPKLVTIDLVCHGVPSAEHLKKYVQYLENKADGYISFFSQRSKSNGWGKCYVEAKVVRKDGKTRRFFVGRNEEYMIDFLSGRLMRDCCLKCKYANTQRVGDLTMGDFWGWQSAGIELNWHKGLSVLYANTEKGIRITKEIKMDLQTVALEKTINNAALNAPTKLVGDRDKVLKAYRDNNISSLYPQKSLKKRLLDYCRNHIPVYAWICMSRIKSRVARILK